MEILYILNGHATVHMEGEEYELNPLDAVVMDYARIHEVICAAADNGNLYPRVKAASAALSAGGGTFAIRCAGQRLRPGQQEYYNEICGYLKELTVLYVNQNETYRLKKHGADSGIAGMSGGTFFRNLSPWWQRRRGRGRWSGWSRSVCMWIITTGKK